MSAMQYHNHIGELVHWYRQDFTLHLARGPQLSNLKTDQRENSVFRFKREKNGKNIEPALTVSVSC